MARGQGMAPLGVAMIQPKDNKTAEMELADAMIKRKNEGSPEGIKTGTKQSE